MLRHIARHRLSIRAVLERQFFDGSSESCHNTINALLKKKLITTHAQGRFSYYEITRAGALEADLSAADVKGVGSMLRERLAVLWYCHMLKASRKLIPTIELRHLFPGTRLQSPHCLAPGKGGKPACIYRVRLAGPNASDWSVLRGLEEQLNAAALPGGDLYPRLRIRQYGFAVLCHGKERLKQLKTRAKEKKLFERVDGERYYRVAHEFVQVPSPETLGEALNELKRQQKRS